MRILTLNLNGIRSATSKGVVSWLAASGADVICLQEVRALPEQAPQEWGALGYHTEWYPAERPGYSGVALLSKTKPKRVTRGMKSCFDCEGRVLQAGHAVYFKRIVPLIGGALSDGEAYRYLPRSTAYLPEPARLQSMAHEAGFAEVERFPLAGGAAQLLVGTRR